MNYCNKSLKKLCIILILSFVIIPFSFALEYLVPQIPYDVTSADIDLDGDIDIIVGSHGNYGANQDTITIFFNDNYYQFFQIKYSMPTHHFIKSATMDEDNYPDLISRSHDSENDIILILNNGFGGFLGFEYIYTGNNIYILDMNNDSTNDIIFYKKGSTDCYWGILENNGFGVFTENLYYTANTTITGFDVGKINEDNYPDIIITTSQYGTIIFYNNLSYFTQENFYPNCYHSPHIFDMNNDSNNDIGIFYHDFFPGAICELKIFYNNGDSTFTQPDTLFFPEGTLIKDVNDYNNDNYPDITYWCYPWAGPVNSIYVCLNNTDGTFADPVEYSIGQPTFFSLISADLDDNNYLDLIMTGYVGDDNLYRVKMLYNDGTGNFVEEPQVGITNYEFQISKCELSNYPNPFNPITTISYDLPVNIENPVIEIFNIKGQKVKTLYPFPNRGLGTRSVVWNGTDENNWSVSTGIYLYQLYIDDKPVATKKMLLMK